jgi:HlyD family secretion protein
MIGNIRKRIILIVIGLLVVAAVIYGFLPEKIPVQTAVVRFSPLEVTVEEEGETRVEDLYVVYSPLTAFLHRIDFEQGDIVQEGQPLIKLEAPRSSILDSRLRAESIARVQAAEAALLKAREQVRGAQAVAEYAAAERRRIERLVATGSAAFRALDEAEAESVQANADLEAARASVAVASADLATARATLEKGSDDEKNKTVREILYAPETGRILTVHRKSEGFVNPGEPLMEIGDIDRLEIVVEVLSQDAVRIRPGNRVVIDQWGGDTPLEAVVSRIEPWGFTKVSALGVEEQRVKVIAKLVSPWETRTQLGSGYRVLARFIIWEGDNILQVPTSALFRIQDEWSVFVVENNMAVRKNVTLGHRAGLAAQVLGGLTEGDRVIVHPDSAINHGTRVDPRWN